jgi:hypothetical protein
MWHLVRAIKAMPEFNRVKMTKSTEATLLVFGDQMASAAALKVKLEEEKKKPEEELEESDYSSLLTDID